MSGSSGVALRYFAGVAAVLAFLGLCTARPAQAQPLEFRNTIVTDDYDGKICSVSLRTSQTTKTRTGKNCVINTYYPVWSDDGKSQGIVQVVKRNSTEKTAEQCWGDPEKKGLALFGLVQYMKVTVPPQYRAIQPIAENVAIAKKCDGTLVIADGRTHTERPFPYDQIAIYPDVFDFSGLVSGTGGGSPPDTPPFVIVRKATHENGYSDYALIGPDGSEAVVWPNLKSADSDILINENGTIYVKMTDPETGATATGIFDARGTEIAIVPEIAMGMNTPCILGKRNPRAVSSYGRYFYPLDTRTGLPLDLPPDIVGFDYNAFNGQLIVITQEDGQLRYRVSTEGIENTLAHYKSLPAFRDVRLVGADDENFSYGKSDISEETRNAPKRPGPVWWWLGRGLAVQFDNGQWGMYEDPLSLDKQPLGATPQEAFNKSYDREYDRVIAYQNGKARDEQRAVANRQQRHADLIAHFEQHLGQDTSEGGCAYPAYSDASMLGGEYLERYVETYGPCTVYDVDAVCQNDGPACSIARRVKSNWEAQMWQEDAERRALAEQLNQAYQTGEAAVSVLIIEGGQMKQERMSRDRYDKYYAPN